MAKQLRNGLCRVHRLSFIMHRPLFSGPGGSLSKLEALDEHTANTAAMYHLDQWRIQKFAEGGRQRGSGGKAPQKLKPKTA